ncbi:hypothetical protein [Endozoicomonas numazuensis]|uniref:hypothetical protein n=1 Tax=Endozoicomonas numazuensis TaxID=1137799 RepID=UPI000B0A705D|nr:hypothetical protein [Endozoicomonas numazuensis]
MYYWVKLPKSIEPRQDKASNNFVLILSSKYCPRNMPQTAINTNQTFKPRYEQAI